MKIAPDDLLLGYAAGTLHEAEDLLVATHLAMSPEARRRLALFDDLGGALLAAAPPTSAAVGLADMLALLDAPPPPLGLPEDAADLAESIPELSMFPEPLRGVVARAGLRWQAVVPGLVHQAVLPVGWSGAPVRLTRVRGGFRVPRHTHQGRELNLVLTGGFTDRGQAFGPGEVSANEEADVHELRIDPGEDCIVLAVNDAPLVPVGLAARIASWLTGF